MPSCALMLEASFVSLAHALIRWNGSQWEVRDLGSTNGTYLGSLRIVPGVSVPLEAGSLLRFGGADETWQMSSASEPRAVALPLEGGEPSVLEGGALPIPSPSDPKATIYLKGAAWWLETDEQEMPLSPGDQFVVAGRSWRFECPLASAVTESATKPASLNALSLSFAVSSNEEHVWLTLRQEDAESHLGERTCFYLALILARERLGARNANPTGPGWLPVDTLLKMVPEYASSSALNVEIFRLRRALADAGVLDAAGVVERRRGELRLGTDRVEIRIRD